MRMGQLVNAGRGVATNPQVKVGHVQKCSSKLQGFLGLVGEWLERVCTCFGDAYLIFWRHATLSSRICAYEGSELQ